MSQQSYVTKAASRISSLTYRYVWKMKLLDTISRWFCRIWILTIVPVIFPTERSVHFLNVLGALYTYIARMYCAKMFQRAKRCDCKCLFCIFQPGNFMASKSTWTASRFAELHDHEFTRNFSRSPEKKLHDRWASIMNLFMWIPFYHLCNSYLWNVKSREMNNFTILEDDHGSLLQCRLLKNQHFRIFSRSLHKFTPREKIHNRSPDLSR